MEPKQLSLFDFVNQPTYKIVSDAFPECESDEIEYKSAEGGFPNDFWKTYSAFANSNGGIIVLGIKERKGNFVIEGLSLDKIDKYKKDFWNNINNPNNSSINLLTDADVKVASHDQKSVLVFRIPSATRNQRPVYLTHNPFDNTYKRNYEGDYKCTKEEVRRMLADADLSIRPDIRILESYSMKDFDMQSVRQYRQLFAATRPDHAWLTLEDKELLTQLGAYRIDRKSQKEGPTFAGILMFGKSSAITDEECCPNFFPDYREILTKDPDIRWTDRIYPDGNWEANLFQFYRLVWPKLSSSLPKPFQLKKGLRHEETPAHTALREAFANALIHTDYTAPGNIIIEQKTDIFKFINPGTLLVTLTQYYQGGISECRNTSIQKMFLMIGGAEKAGSGVNKIMSGWSYAHWRSPYLTIESQPDRLILELPMFSILPEETLHQLKNLFGNSIDRLDKHELTILAACNIEGEITNSRLQYMIDRHRTDITKILQDLCKTGFLISENKSRWTTYHLNIDFLVNKYDLEKPKVDTSAPKVDTSAPKVDTSAPKVDTSAPKVDTSAPKVDTSAPKVDTSVPKVDTSAPKVDTSAPKVDTSVLYSKKLSIKELKASIIECCQSEYLSLEEIGNRIGRNTDYLKNKIFPELVDTGVLEKLYPDITNHPNQKYRAKQ